MENITNEISRLKVLFCNVYTSVFFVKIKEGLLIFDCATCDSDVEEFIIPEIINSGYSPNDVKYIFISHNHSDHSGGLSRLSKFCKNATIVAKDEELKDKFQDVKFINPKDGYEITSGLTVVEIPGHTLDSTALLDNRTKTLLTGDCLQLYGVFGSGAWGSNITHLKEHFCALSKLKTMDVSLVCASHDYHPMGNSYEGDDILNAYDLCVKPLKEIKEFVNKNPGFSDEEITTFYNKKDIPDVGVWVFKAIRKYKGSFEIK